VGVTNYLIERCTGASCSSFTQIGTSTGAAFSSTGLVSGTSYSYRVRASDAASNLSDYSNTATATTSAMPAGLVAAYSFNEGSGTTVTDLSGNNNTGTIVGATWTPSGKYGNALAFNGSSSYVDLGNPTSLQLTGSMTVEAWVNAAADPADDGQIVAKSDDAAGWQFKTSPDTGPETFGMGVSGSSTTHTQRYSTTVRSLNTWYHVAGVYDATTGTLSTYVNGVLDNGTLRGTIPATQFDQSVNVNIGRRTGGYYFNGVIDEVRIYNRALSQAEIQSDMNTPLGVTVDTTPPTAPSNLVATAASTQINLSWAASTDNVGVTSYLIERCQGAGCSNFTQVATSTTTTFSDRGLAASTSYSYQVRAMDGAGNLSPYSNVATAVTQTPDTQPPTTPTNLTATAISGSQINLSWTASTDNVGVTGYLVERCTGASCTSFARQTTVPGTTYSDTGLVPNTSYTYQVKATDAAGNFSLYSNQATVTTLATPAGLVAAYSFDEGSGTTVTDLSGHNLNGTIVGATWTTNGKYGNALSFDGTSSYVDLGNPAALQLTGSMTVEAWVNAAANPADDGQIVAKSDDGSGWQFKTSPDIGPVTFGMGVSGSPTSRTQRYSTTVRSLNTWYYVAGVYDATNQTLSTYVNGVLDNGVLRGVVPAAQINSAVNAYIGRRSGGYYFNGIIDEVRIYNVALNLDQIRADMTIPVGGASSPLVNLSTTSLGFGDRQTGIPGSPLPVTLTNVGGGTLAISSIGISGGNSGDFTQTNNCGSTLAVGASCTINVTFTASATGTRSSSLTITDNAPGSPHTVALSGTGTGFDVMPHVAVITSSQTEQFTASSGSATWSVDGVPGGSSSVGTITPGGLYTPPSTSGSHVVTATVVSPPQSTNATVYVSNYAGTFTHHNDNLRTGVNSQETVLTPSNVNSAQFGKLFSYPLDGIAYAAPLYAANVNIPGKGLYNVVYVGTQQDTVYAFDANGIEPSPLWQVNLLGPNETVVSCSDVNECNDISLDIGIVGSPVIDPTTGTLYVVAKSKQGSTFIQRLHALDIATGAEKFGGPVTISGSVPGSGDGSSGGQLQFSAMRENQRPALALINGVVYIAWSAHGDNPPWHGWVIGYNATTLQRTMIYCVSPDGYGGGIWQSGGAPASDASGNLYFTTANGDFNANTGGKDYGDTIVKLSPSGNVVDYFTPYDQGVMEAQNLDLSSAGPVLLVDQPGTVPHLLISAAKGGTIYVVNRDNMGHYQSNSNSQIIQSIPDALRHGGDEEGNYSSPVFFNNHVYFGAVSDTIKAFQLSNGLLSTTPTSQTAQTYPNRGASFAVSANGTNNAILWAVQDNSPSNGVLRAYDANNLGTEFYDSAQAGPRDDFGLATKFHSPLVANGKVFLVTYDHQLVGFGLLP
jgi:chitodextrinase